MAIIAARKPYYIDFFGQTLQVDLYIYDYDATPPTIGVDEPNYTLKKVSFADGVDENLRLDISPYIRDFFDHSKATDDFSLPNEGQQMPTDMYLKVDAVVNSVEENHTALDGWLEMGESTTEGINDYNRNYYGSDTYLTFRKGSFTTVRYTAFNGSTNSYTLAATTNGYLNITPTSPIFEAGKSFTMELIGAKTATYTFNMTCPFENEYSYILGFTNKWGLVEWIDVSGAVDRSISVSSSDFIKASDYKSKVYNKDGKYLMTINTGWLSGEYPSLAEGLMMSENVWIKSGSVSDKYFGNETKSAIIKNTSMATRDNRKDKLVNYTFSLELTPSIIYG